MTEPKNTALTGQRRHPLWVRALALCVIWTIELQPAFAASSIAQQPLFTVTSVPPNVLLMFDDSGSMNQLSLNTPPAMLPVSYPLQIGGNPALKLNTTGYYGISGVRYYAGGNSAYDGRWTFSLAEVMARSAAFNPLAYNPAVQYQPWNNNGTRFPSSFYGGNTNVASAPLTRWDMRNLPSGVSVNSKIPTPRSGVITSAGALRSFTVPTGSVRYDGLPSSTAAPEGADLFTGTIAWNNPDCGTPVVTQNYGWTCPSGAAWANPAETCNSGNVGNDAVGRTCCTSTSTTSSSAPANANRDVWYTNPPGSPPAMTGPGGETCNSINPTGATWLQTGLAPCTTTDPPPYVAPCSGGGGELCVYDPPPTTTCTGTQLWYQWRCNYDYTQTTSTTTCNTQIPQVCSNTGSTSTCPYGQALTTTSNAQYTGGYWTPARYVVYDGPLPGNSADHRNLNNYRMVMIDRKFDWNGTGRNLTGTNLADAVGKWYVVDAVTGLPGFRQDCTVNAGQDGTWCTFEQEAQNYANWYTYYRSRLFAAVGVLSEVLSNFTGPEQFMRLGYGTINYFPGALNPWNVNSVTDIPNPTTLPSADSDYGGSATNEGGVVRGVRPFTVYDPPASSTPNPKRAEVFNWLFSINGLGPTPNRETIHGAGLYFSRTDSAGPWGAYPGQGTEPSTDHLWCRRNYTVLATDGEWTRLQTSYGFTPQRLLERAGDFSTLDPAGTGGSVSNSLSTTGPAMTGSDRLTNAPKNYQYVPASEPQMSGGSGSTQTETLSDVLHYYWSRDLRSDLRNSIDPTPKNRAFWQHMSSYVVGYGVSASMDDPAASPPLRTVFDARASITWPTVGLEDCRQLDSNTADAAIPGRPPCTLTVSPSGNRINDTLRGALVTGGDFFSAQSPAALRSALEAVFSAISAENAAGTAPGLSSSSVGAGNVIVQSGFFTNTWEGYVQAFDQVALLTFLQSGGAAPAPLWTANFPAPASRNLYTSTAIGTPVTFSWGSLTATQQGAIDAPNVGNGSSPVFDFLRGDATGELRNGGIYRNRFNTILGDVVNSSPLYSKASDFAYQLTPAGSKTLPTTATQGADVYRAYVTTKQTTRNEVVVFGANDGYVHVLDARVGQATSGRELMGFVPRALLANIRELSLPAYAHRYFADGPIVEGDVWNGTAWKTIAVGTTGAGKAGMYALDITSPQSGFNSSNVLWDIVPSEHADSDVQDHLGNVLQPGVIASVKDTGAANGAGRWVYITGNGYESVKQEATLLIFDVFTGALIKAIKTGDGSPGNPNGLGAVTPVYDGNRNVVAVYAGDKRGNLWKFDLTSDTPNDPDGGGPLKGWGIYNNNGSNDKPLFTATDASNNRQAIAAAPRITTHPLGGLYVTFGTGKMFEATDPSDTQVQAIYVLWDQGQVAPITKAQLEQIALQEFPVDEDANPATPDVIFRNLKAADLANYDWTDKGFYIPLIKEGGTAEGERVLVAPILDAGTLAVTTYAPTSGTDQCIPGGVSYLYRLNLSGDLTQSGFLTTSGTTIANAAGRRIQPGLVSSAPPVHQAVAPTGTLVDSMTAADVKTMLQNPKYSVSSGVAVQNGPVGTCAHVGLRVDGTVARIPTACAGLLPMRSWRPVR
ncbi:MAG TPA: PilC/PilY family type IV pilus protein [Burkholderiaceae bacterium]|nr:PilC/PilY family type IV pilus protein [Burkholderiaceae bacterium]HQR71659.1 PilC/PilY family type IV pilus protein [Burkholderiaceae bacterium]